MKLYWAAEGLADRVAIYDYVDANNPEAALVLGELFSKTAERLQAHPMLGWPGRVDETRELVAHENFILVYDIVGDQVRVLRVLHAARQWPPR